MNGYWFRLHSACKITNAKQFKSLSNESIGKMYLQRVTHTMWGKKPKDNIPDGTCEMWKRVFPQLSFRNGYLLLMQLPNEEKRLSNKWKRIKAIRKNHTSLKEKYEKVWPNKIFATMILWRKWNVQTWISTVSSDVYVWSVAYIGQWPPAICLDQFIFVPISLYDLWTRDTWSKQSSQDR